MRIENLIVRIPRPVKAIVCAVCVVVLAIVYYIALGCPTTFRQEFRRAEKAHLVGPSKIVDQVSMSEYYEFKNMLVGETDYGIIFFGQYATTRSDGEYSGEVLYRFSYQEKTGDVTFAAPPNVFGAHGMYELPVYIFTEHDNAVRATVSITLTGTRSYTLHTVKVDDPFDVTFQAEASRDQNGFFRFNLTAPYNYTPSDPHGMANDDSYALFCLSTLCSKDTVYNSMQTMVIPIQVRLFDAEGNEILNTQISIGPHRSPESEV